MEYELLPRAAAEKLIDYSWFKRECFLMIMFEGPEYVGCGYWVPMYRLEELRQIDDVILKFKKGIKGL